MASIIKLKRSLTTGAIPSTLVEGEIAVNVEDKKLFVGGKNGGANVQTLSGDLYNLSSAANNSHATTAADIILSVDNEALSNDAITLIGIQGVDVERQSNGAITIAAAPASSVGTLSGDSGTASPQEFNIKVLGGEGIDTLASGNTITISGEDASTTNKGVAKFNTASFDVSSGDVTIKTGGVNSSQILNKTIVGGDIADGTLSSVHISTGGITSNAIGTSAVTSAKIGASQVTTVKINDGAVTTAKLAADAVDGTKIADDSIDSEHLVDGSIDAAHIATGAVTTTQILDKTILGGDIADGTITSTQIGAGAIQANAIAAGVLTATEIQDKSITGAKLVDGTITSTQIAAGGITANAIGNDSVSLGAKTTGNYIATVSGDTEILVSGSGSETAAVTLAIGDNISANTTGNAATATQLATGRSIALGGDLSGSATFNGTSDITITATIGADSVALGTDTTGNYVESLSGTANEIEITGGAATEGGTPQIGLPDAVTIQALTVAGLTTLSSNVAINGFNTAIAGNTSIAGNLSVDGDLAVEGALTYISSSTVNIDDSMLKLSANNSADITDSGVYARYVESATNKYAGYFRDATDDVFKFYYGLESEPGATVDTTATGYTLAQIDAIIDGGTY